MARLEILYEALDPLFSEIPAGVDLFDRGISQGDTPRLWIDSVAHISMGRDKRIYRFTQDTRFGRIVIAESHDVPVMVDAVTDYIARRLIEREHAMVVTPASPPAPALASAPATTAATASSIVAPVKRRSAIWTFAFGFAAGLAALFGFALVMALRRPQGATSLQLMLATGWQPHTVRGAISGMLRKKLGLKVVLAHNDTGERVYRVV